MPGLIWGYLLGGAIGGLIVAIITIFSPRMSPVTAPIYAALEGLFLGAFSAMFEYMYPGIIPQAVILTFGTLAALLVAYRLRLIKATENFKIRTSGHVDLALHRDRQAAGEAAKQGLAPCVTETNRTADTALQRPIMFLMFGRLGPKTPQKADPNAFRRSIRAAGPSQRTSWTGTRKAHGSQPVGLENNRSSILPGHAP